MQTNGEILMTGSQAQLWEALTFLTARTLAAEVIALATLVEVAGDSADGTALVGRVRLRALDQHGGRLPEGVGDHMERMLAAAEAAIIRERQG
ncbi:hypothetical protein BBAL3_1213 [Brevundimonas sp. BAL3]|nr:hypothetical protein BBAL3_1213 [Brevundimonas sp. BAL3]